MRRCGDGTFSTAYNHQQGPGADVAACSARSGSAIRTENQCPIFWANPRRGPLPSYQPGPLPTPALFHLHYSAAGQAFGTPGGAPPSPSSHPARGGRVRGAWRARDGARRGTGRPGAVGGAARAPRPGPARERVRRRNPNGIMTRLPRRVPRERPARAHGRLPSREQETARTPEDPLGRGAGTHLALEGNGAAHGGRRLGMVRSGECSRHRGQRCEPKPQPAALLAAQARPPQRPPTHAISGTLPGLAPARTTRGASSRRPRSGRTDVMPRSARPSVDQQLTSPHAASAPSATVTPPAARPARAHRHLQPPHRVVVQSSAPPPSHHARNSATVREGDLHPSRRGRCAQNI